MSQASANLIKIIILNVIDRNKDACLSKKKIKIFNLTFIVLMSDIQDRNNITNCYIYYITNIILRLADQQIT